MTAPLFHEDEDWTFPLLDRTYKAIEDIALGELKLNVYPNQIEIIDSEQMLESYTSVGMPNYYRHWSFGKSYESQAKQYKEGYSNLAYEIVLNCLKAGTKVTTRNGEINIEDLKVGDEVYDSQCYVKVTLIKKSSDYTNEICLKDGTKISATKEHVFPVLNEKGRNEIRVDEIKIGDKFLKWTKNEYSGLISTDDLHQEEIVSIIKSTKADDVYDITVDSKSHLFLANNILTHNCSPTIAYLQENNTMTMQALVIAHASFGHNAVFKNNEYFTTWTQAGSIMDYLSFARNYITKCETLYGEDEVEKLIDSCHALQYHGVNTYKKKVIHRKKKDDEIVEDDDLDLKVNFSRLLDKTITVPKPEEKMTKPKSNKDNILYFIEKNSPALPEWKKEIIRIVRTIAQYFYPQMITKVVNEGYASYTHYRIMKRLHEKGLITDGSWLEFVLSHTNVVAQSGVAYGQFRSWNPYALGFAIFQDIERICTNPTQEDKEYFPSLIGQDSITATNEAMSSYNDSGFINQYLSPKVMRDFKMFSIFDKEKNGKQYLVNAVTDDSGYTAIRNALSIQHERNYMIPNIEVIGANLHENRKLVLKYNPYRERTLSAQTKTDMIEHLKNLWGYDVVID